MGDETNDETPQAQVPALIQRMPVPTQIAVQIVTMPDGQRQVMLRFVTWVSDAAYFLEPPEAEQVARDMVKAASAARIALAPPPGANGQRPILPPRG